MKKRPTPRTPEERAAARAKVAALEARIAAVTGELEASGSDYAGVGRREQLDFALRRLEAEFGASSDPN